MKSISLSLAVMAGFTLLAGAVIPSSPGRAQERPPVSPAPPDTPLGLVEETLIVRGNAFLEAGDFASARVLYQAAANQGSGQAAMLAGVTYDPRFRELAGISGPQSNAKLARQWYALAMRRGDTQAERNDLELVQWLKDQNIDPATLAEIEETEEASAGREAEPESETLAEADPHQAEGETTVSMDTPTPLPVARPEAEAQSNQAEDEATVAVDTSHPPAPVARPETQSALPEAKPAPTPAIETAAEPGSPVEMRAVIENNRGPDTASASAEPAAETPVLAATEPPSQLPSEVPVADARVVRAQLTTAVTNREPVDRLPSSIQVSDGRLERIVFFSEVQDLSGQTLSHRWEHRGETVADISFVVGSDTWRMHSAKRVTSAMTGEWRVVVVDEVGAELASVPFVLE